MDEKRTGYISIGEMAKMNRTTVPTLRLYDSMNLLTPCYVDEKTCYRYYDIKQNARLDMIQYMKDLGMELKEIKEIPVPERVQGSLVSGSKISILDGSLG